MCACDFTSQTQPAMKEGREKKKKITENESKGAIEIQDEKKKWKTKIISSEIIKFQLKKKKCRTPCAAHTAVFNFVTITDGISDVVCVCVCEHGTTRPREL